MSKAAKTAARKSGSASVDAMDAYGIDKLLEAVVDGKSLTAIAKEAEASLTRLLAWIDADPERSARVREARAAMAKVWDEKAEEEIRSAGEEFDLKKARELAHHYRWRAAKVAPREYGDRIQHANDPENPMPGRSDAELDARIQELLGKGGA